MTITDVSRDSYDSRLYWADHPDSNDCILLKLKVRVHVSAAPAGSYSFRATVPDPNNPAATVRQNTALQVSPWQQSNVDQFKNQLRDAVYRIWNDKLWLRHSGAMTYEHRLGTSHYWNVKCSVELSFVDDPDDAQLCVLMIYQPTGKAAGLFRANCALGGRSRWGPRSWFNIGDNPIDMRVTDTAGSTDVNRSLPVSDPGPNDTNGNHRFTQNTVGHEFGHYLGLSHACAAAGGLNSSAQYCGNGTIQQQRSLMAAGNDIRPAHAWPWKNRLSAHGYLTDRTWRGLTRAPARHARQSG